MRESHEISRRNIIYPTTAIT